LIKIIEAIAISSKKKKLKNIQYILILNIYDKIENGGLNLEVIEMLKNLLKKIFTPNK
jgi:hypothetical protein